MATQTLLIKTRGRLHLGLEVSKMGALLLESIRAKAPSALSWEVDLNVLSRLAAREDFIQKELIRRQGDFDTLLLLGCGYSDVDDALRGKSVIHVDYAEVVQKKKKIYAQQGISGGNRTQFVAADVDQLQFQNLEVKGRLMICMEGLSYYLRPTTMERLFSFTREASATMMFDYFSESAKDRRSPYPGVSALMETLKKEGHPVRWGVEPIELGTRLAPFRLRVICNIPFGEIMANYGLDQDPWVHFAVVDPAR